MKLFIDDIREAPDSSWTVVRTPSEAIRAIYHFSNDITDISFDHDAGDTESFQLVAYYFGLMLQSYRLVGQVTIGLPWEPRVTIHSANSIAAMEIAKILKDHDVYHLIRPYEVFKTML